MNSQIILLEWEMNTEKHHWIYVVIGLNSTIKALEAFTSSLIQGPYGHRQSEYTWVGETEMQNIYSTSHCTEEATECIPMSSQLNWKPTLILQWKNSKKTSWNVKLCFFRGRWGRDHRNQAKKWVQPHVVQSNTWSLHLSEHKFLPWEGYWYDCIRVQLGFPKYWKETFWQVRLVSEQEKSSLT